MGKSFHVVSPLESPLTEVEDRVMFIPAASELVVEGVPPRVLLVCDGRARVHVNAQFLGEIGPGDIIIIPGPARVVYRSMQERRESRLHVFRVLLDPKAFTCDPNTGWLVPLGAKHDETNFVVFLQNRLARLRHLARGATPAIHALLETIRRDAEIRTEGFGSWARWRSIAVLTMPSGRIGSTPSRSARTAPSSSERATAEESCTCTRLEGSRSPAT